MVLPEIVALPFTLIAVWGPLLSLYYLLWVITKILWGLLVLMLWVLLQIWNLIYSTWWHVASAANSLIAYIWSGVCLPFQFLLHVIKHFGLLSLVFNNYPPSSLHIILCILTVDLHVLADAVISVHYKKRLGHTTRILHGAHPRK